jgi:hypothetical protein
MGYEELEEVEEDLTFAVTDEFFIRRNGKVKGPMDAKRIRKLVKSKNLKPSDEVSLSVDGPWDRLATAYKDIVSGSPETGVTPPKVSECDGCGGMVSMRAKNCLHCGSLNGAADDNLEMDADWRGDDFNVVAKLPPRMSNRKKKVAKPLDGVEWLGSEGHVARMANYQKYRTTLHITAGVVLFIIVVGVPLSWTVGTDFWGVVYENRPVEQVASRSEPRESSARGTVQKGIFENAIRAAMDFEPSASSSYKNQLQSELRLIKPGIKSKADQNIYDVLEIVLGTQQERQHLAFVVANFGTMWTGYALKLGAMAEGVAIQKRYGDSSNLKPSDLKFLDRLYESVETAAQLSSGGNVVISISSPNTEVEEIHALIEESGIADIAKKYSVRTSSRSGVTFFSASELRTKLKLFESASLDAANQMRLK